MAKRFTDTEKWKRPWFSELDSKSKLAWIYLLDNCDHTGVWHSNYSLMSFQIGFKVQEKDIIQWFGEKIAFLDKDKLFIKSFIDFQYGALNPSNNAHKPVIKLLERIGPIEDLKCSSQRAQDKDKVLVQEPEQDKDKVQDSDSEKEFSKKLTPEQKELNSRIWHSYFDAYLQRYKVEPVRNAAVNSQISNLGKRLGEDAVEVVAFFVSSNNGFYLQKLHQVGLCLADAESLHTQWRRGRAITQNDVRSFEKNQAKFDAANSFSLGFDDERKLIE